MLFTLFKNKKRNKGFTFVEMLVVVLIIGVLSAIALPTYRRAVERTRAVQGITTLEHIAKAQVAYNAKRGEYASTAFSLPINLEDNNGNEVSGSQFNDQFFTYNIFGNQQASATAARSTGEYTLLIDYASGEVTCQAVEGSTICERLGLGEENGELPNPEYSGSVQESQSDTESDSGSNTGSDQNSGTVSGEDQNSGNESGNGSEQNSGTGSGEGQDLDDESGNGSDQTPGNDSGGGQDPDDESGNGSDQNSGTGSGEDQDPDDEPLDPGDGPGTSLVPPEVVIWNPELVIQQEEYTDSNYRQTCVGSVCDIYKDGERIDYNGNNISVVVMCDIQNKRDCTITYQSNSDNDSEWTCEDGACTCTTCFNETISCTLNSTNTGCVNGDEIRWFDTLYKKYNDAANYAIVDITGEELAGSIVSNEDYINKYDAIIKYAIRNGISIEDTTEKLFNLYKEYLKKSS